MAQNIVQCAQFSNCQHSRNLSGALSGENAICALGGIIWSKMHFINMGPRLCFRAHQKLPETRRTAPNSYGNSLAFSFQIRFIGGPRFWTFRVFGLLEALKVVLGGWRPLVFEIFTSRSHRDQNQSNPSTLAHFIGRNASGI